MELIASHPKRIRTELGMNKEVFSQLISELHAQGCSDTKNVTLEEQLAIFPYICVTGLTVQHVGKCFQRSSDTISQYVN